MRITHLTSAHPRYDTRIFIKECASLAKIEDYEVNLIVADSLGDEEKNNVNIIDVGKLQGRLNRIFKTTKNVLAKAVELDSDIYQLYDPELISVGLKLKKLYEYISLGLPMIGALPQDDGLDIINKQGYGLACQYYDLKCLTQNMKKIKDKNYLKSIRDKISKDKDSWAMKNTILEQLKL